MQANNEKACGHGQLPPWTQDGFPWPETPALANGAVQSYDYAPIPGTYWIRIATRLRSD
jgi:hypothetical protein